MPRIVEIPEDVQSWEEVKNTLQEAMIRAQEAEYAKNLARESLRDAMKKMRQLCGISQEQMAKLMHITTGYLSMLEIGKRQWSSAMVDRFLIYFA